MLDQLMLNCVLTTLFYLLLFACYSLFSKPSNKIQLCDILLIVFLIIATGIRYDVGADWQQYYRGYSNILTVDGYINQVISWYGLDSGFWILMSYISRIPFGNSPYAIFWTTSILTYPAVVIYFRKKTDSAPWALLVYCFLGFFGSSINVLRHTLAATCFLWSYEARICKKPIVFILLSALAIVFHSSVVFAIGVALVAYRKRPTYKLLLSCIGAGVLALTLFSGLFNALTGMLPFLSRFQTIIDGLNASLDRRYMWIVSLIYFVLSCVAVTIYIHETVQDQERDVRMDSLVSAVCFAIIPNIVSFVVWPIDRMAFFIIQFCIAIIPFLVKRNQTLQVVALLAMCLWHIPYALFAWDNVNAFSSYLFD